MGFVRGEAGFFEVPFRVELMLWNLSVVLALSLSMLVMFDMPT